MREVFRLPLRRISTGLRLRPKFFPERHEAREPIAHDRVDQFGAALVFGDGAAPIEAHPAIAMRAGLFDELREFVRAAAEREHLLDNDRLALLEAFERDEVLL